MITVCLLIGVGLLALTAALTTVLTPAGDTIRPEQHCPGRHRRVDDTVEIAAVTG